MTDENDSTVDMSWQPDYYRPAVAADLLQSDATLDLAGKVLEAYARLTGHFPDTDLHRVTRQDVLYTVWSESSTEGFVLCMRRLVAYVDQDGNECEFPDHVIEEVLRAIEAMHVVAYWLEAPIRGES